MFGFLLLGAAGALYFVPTLVASRRDHHQRTPIFVLNLFLGWTFLGWVVALVWSLTAIPGATEARAEQHAGVEARRKSWEEEDAARQATESPGEVTYEISDDGSGFRRR